MNIDTLNKFNIEKNKNLSKLNRFCTGGYAEYFFEPKTIDSFTDFLKLNTLDITVLGGGSNILIREKGINGIVISTKYLNKINFDKNVGEIICESGVSNFKLYNFTKNNEIDGYEFLGTIPGSIGGGCLTNAGCYGGEISDNILKVKICDKKGNIKILNKEECQFSYRNSIFKCNDIILEIFFRVNSYKSKFDIEKIFKDNLSKRENSQPYYEKTCGSTFKNLVEMPAWKIIQELGLQGKEFNGCKFSEKHANFLVNFNNSTSNDIENLIELAKKKALKEKNIILETEVKILGVK